MYREGWEATRMVSMSLSLSRSNSGGRFCGFGLEKLRVEIVGNDIVVYHIGLVYHTDYNCGIFYR